MYILHTIASYAIMQLRGDFMRRLIIFVFSIVLLVPLLSSVAYAHPGKTDSNGGHYDRDSGEYHYHHGYPAHQHTDGKCPYDFDDRTGESSGSPSGSNTTRVPSSGKSKTSNCPIWLKNFLTFLKILILLPALLLTVWHLYIPIKILIVDPLCNFIKRMRNK